MVGSKSSLNIQCKFGIKFYFSRMVYYCLVHLHIRSELFILVALCTIWTGTLFWSSTLPLAGALRAKQEGWPDEGIFENGWMCLGHTSWCMRCTVKEDSISWVQQCDTPTSSTRTGVVFLPSQGMKGKYWFKTRCIGERKSQSITALNPIICVVVWTYHLAPF